MALALMQAQYVVRHSAHPVEPIENDNLFKNANVHFKMTSRDALSRTERVVTSIWPTQRGMRITPRPGLSSPPLTLNGGNVSMVGSADAGTKEKVPTGLRAGSGGTAKPAMAHWLVFCETASGETLGSVCWNAETGRLDSIVGTTDSVDASAYTAMTNRELDSLARQWIRQLPDCAGGESWRLARFSRSKSCADSEWRRAEQRIRICINPVSGALLMYSRIDAKR